ncbi:MAG: carbon-nitrogen hydrolase [Cyanothece sp. SIO1E1]|nr:carbon-nitrogen hydrolase [Cyanothece sp. SIO1E1]
MSVLKVGIVQHACGHDKFENISHTLVAIGEAADAGAKLVILQELHCSPYFCQVEEVSQFDWADTIPGETVNIYAEAARNYQVVLVTSLFEKRAAGIYHNTAVVFEKDGSVAGKYRKMHIPDDPAYYEKFYFTPGDLGFEPIDTSVGRLGVLICWDQWYPEAARLMALAGAELLIYPTAIGYETSDDEAEQQRQLDAWRSIQRGHAVANGLPVVCVNRTGFEQDWSGQTKGIQFWGRSFVAGPQGEILFEAPQDRACVEVVEIDKDRTEEVRRIWPFFRDRRIDAYQGLLKRYLD